MACSSLHWQKCKAPYLLNTAPSGGLHSTSVQRMRKAYYHLLYNEWKELSILFIRDTPCSGRKKPSALTDDFYCFGSWATLRGVGRKLTASVRGSIANLFRPLYKFASPSFPMFFTSNKYFRFVGAWNIFLSSKRKKFVTKFFYIIPGYPISISN